jgi:hypothetical protein
MRKTPGGPVTAVVLNIGLVHGEGLIVPGEIDLTPEEADRMADRLHQYADLVRAARTE